MRPVSPEMGLVLQEESVYCVKEAHSATEQRDRAPGAGSMGPRKLQLLSFCIYFAAFQQGLVLSFTKLSRFEPGIHFYNTGPNSIFITVEKSCLICGPFLGHLKKARAQTL